jgi:glycoprotein endo-alpha-1,2-mannosidase
MSLRAAGALLLALAPALLGYALAEIDHRAPLWLHPRLWTVSRPAQRAATLLPRRVLAFHYVWYGTPDGPTGRWRHWAHPRRDVGADRLVGFHPPRRRPFEPVVAPASTHTPLNAPYDSRDPRVVARQFREARLAGLDGFVVSWWGRESPEATTFAMLLEAARGTGLVLAPYYEAGELWPRGGPGVARDLETLLDRHGAASAFLRVDGVPVVFVYGAQRVRPGAWDYVRRRLHAGGRAVYLIGDSHRPRWIPFFDALHVYTPVRFLARGEDLDAVYREWAETARAHGRPFLPAVAPGSDDGRIRQPATVIPRQNGETYDATWRAALAVGPPWVLVASWNEWHEGSEIEPSQEHGTRYLAATRAWAARFREAP